MGRKRAAPKGKKINPTFWVFCEGKTEEAYIALLRSKYRVPIEIVPKVLGNKINEHLIKRIKKERPVHEKDKDFLVYDADVPEILEKLKRIRNVTLIASNPAIELWFLLHYKNQTSNISSRECTREISNRLRKEYKKGTIEGALEAKLLENCQKACKRAKNLELYENPSSNMYFLIETLEEEKGEL